MKNNFFLLALLTAAFAPVSSIIADNSSCCTTACATECNTCENDCSNTCNSCNLYHGHVQIGRSPQPWKFASPEYSSMFNSSVIKNLADDKSGEFQIAVFGGKSTNGSRAAAYVLPNGFSTLTIDGSVNNRSFAAVAAESIAVATGAGNLTVGTNVANITGDMATYKFDTTRDTSRVLAWNLGITFAALYEPLGSSALGELEGSGLVTVPEFKSTITPCYKHTSVGAGATLRYHFSENKEYGFYGRVSTAVQRVSARLNLNEVVETEKTTLLNDSLAAANIYGAPATPVAATNAVNGVNHTTFQGGAVSTVDPVGSLLLAYVGTDFPTEANGKAVNNATQAFAQEAWNYGKISDCSLTKTRLTEVDLALGYQWTCSDCASTSWELGVAIATGNKPCGVYIAEPIVGNGGHHAIRTGGVTHVSLSEKDSWKATYRIDTDARYLFRNTQTRSFDVLGNAEWSRYMMVWANEDAYTTAVAAANTITAGSGVANRSYTPGINIFTSSFYVKPKFEGTINQALVLQGEKFYAELGWAVSMKNKECVELACGWDSKPAFADSSYLGGVGLNNDRTIFNDAQTSAYNAVTNLTRVNTTPTPDVLVTIAGNDLAATEYSDFAIGEDRVNLDSVAHEGFIRQQPYMVLGYTFDSECKPAFSIGGSYSFSASNASVNEWMVWGKFEVAF